MFAERRQVSNAGDNTIVRFASEEEDLASRKTHEETQQPEVDRVLVLVQVQGDEHCAWQPMRRVALLGRVKHRLTQQHTRLQRLPGV